MMRELVQVLTVPSSILAVVDASDVDEPRWPPTARPGWTSRSTPRSTALDAFPDHARIGLWAFSTEQRAAGPGLARARAAASPRRPGRGRRDPAPRAACASRSPCCPDPDQAAGPVCTTRCWPAYQPGRPRVQPGLLQHAWSCSPTARTTTRARSASRSSLSELEDDARPGPPGAHRRGRDRRRTPTWRRSGKIAEATGGQAFEADSPEDDPHGARDLRLLTPD